MKQICLLQSSSSSRGMLGLAIDIVLRFRKLLIFMTARARRKPANIPPVPAPAKTGTLGAIDESFLEVPTEGVGVEIAVGSDWAVKHSYDPLAMNQLAWYSHEVDAAPDMEAPEAEVEVCVS